MKNLLLRHGVYEAFGHVVVGVYFIFSAILMYCLVVDKNMIENLFSLVSIGNFIFALFISYLFGHILQSFSSIFITSEKGKSHDFDHVLKKCKIMFNIPEKKSNGFVFQYCYLYSLPRDNTGHIVTFHSLYSLYRGMQFISILLFSISLILVVFSFLYNVYVSGSTYEFSLLFYSYFAFNTLLIWVFNKRRVRFFNLMTKKIYIIFDIITNKNY